MTRRHSRTAWKLLTLVAQVAALTTAVARPAPAQEPVTTENPDRPPRPYRADRPERQLRREFREQTDQNPNEMRETMALFFFHKVRTELELTDEQSVRLLPLIQAVEAARNDSEKKRREAAHALERLAQDPLASAVEVGAQIAALDREEERSRIEQARMRDEMLALFTPQQKARFVVFANRFRRAIEDRMRGVQRGPGRGENPGRGEPRDQEGGPPPPRPERDGEPGNR